MAKNPERTRTRWILTAVLAAAAILRLAHWWAVREGPFVATLVMDSQEYDRWARELAAGDWLGSAAFFQAPLYPYLLGALYSLFGPRPDAAYLLQIGVALIAVYALYRCGLELESPALGLSAAALVAASGILVFHDVLLLKESLATSLMALLLWCLLAARRQQRVSQWALAGVLLGLVAGLRENALLLVFPVLALPWLASVERRGLRQWAASSAWFMIGLLVTLVPSAARNYALTGELLLTTYQGGVNFYIGNNPRADGTYRPLVPGKQVPALERTEPERLAEAATGRSLSGREVSRYWLGQSLAWAGEDPVSFARLQVRKLRLFWSFYEQPDAVDYYWMRQRSRPLRLALVELGALALLAAVGLGLVRHRWREWLPVLVILAGWMVVTVIFFVFSRYRLPVIPALALLAAVPIARLGALAGAPPRRSAVAGVGAALGLALLLPHLARYSPRLDLVHFNLGRLEEEGGDLAAAERHYRIALAAGPDALLPRLNLGNLAARRGELEDAAAWYRAAVDVEPRSDDAWANLGAALLGLGRIGDATDALGHALALNPTHLSAQHSMALLEERRGRPEEAREWNRRVLALDPDHLPARRQLQRLAADRPEETLP